MSSAIKKELEFRERVRSIMPGSSDKSYELRKTLRVSFARPFADFSLIQLGTRPRTDVLRGKVLDLSGEGMGMRVSEDDVSHPDAPPIAGIEPGTVIQTRIGVSVAGVTVDLPVMGQVIWIRKERDRSHRLGVRFLV